MKLVFKIKVNVVRVTDQDMDEHSDYTIRHLESAKEVDDLEKFIMATFKKMYPTTEERNIFILINYVNMDIIRDIKRPVINKPLLLLT